MARQRARVDARDAGDARRLQVLAKRLRAAPARGQVGQLTHDEAAHLDAIALVVGVVDAVVALDRVGHGQDLTAVRGVGEGLLVAGHRGVEDHLAGGAHVGAVALALEDPAVGQHQPRARGRAHMANAVSSVKLTWYVHASTFGNSAMA